MDQWNPGNPEDQFHQDIHQYPADPADPVLQSWWQSQEHLGNLGDLHPLGSPVYQ